MKQVKSEIKVTVGEKEISEEILINVYESLTDAEQTLGAEKALSALNYGASLKQRAQRASEIKSEQGAPEARDRKAVEALMKAKPHLTREQAEAFVASLG